MFIKDIESASPQRQMVVVKILNLQGIIEQEDFSTEDKIAVRCGEVISLGQDVKLPEHCSDLKVGDKAVFSDFAGYYLPTEDAELYKLVRGYDVIGIMDDVLEDAVPTANRVLVEELRAGDGDDGGLISTTPDPREASLTYGTVSKVGADVQNVKELVKGAVVAYYPHVGTSIRGYESSDKKELKIIVEEDILLLM